MQVKITIVWIECESNSGDDDDDGDNIEDMEEDDDGDGITNEGKIEYRKTILSLPNFQMIVTTTEMTFLMKKRRLTMTMMTTALTMKLMKTTTMTVSLMLVSRIVQPNQQKLIVRYQGTMTTMVTRFLMRRKTTMKMELPMKVTK